MRILTSETIVNQSRKHGTALECAPGKHNYKSPALTVKLAEHHQANEKRGHKWCVAAEEDGTFTVLEEFKP